MNNNWYKNILLVFFLILFQVLIFNNIRLFKSYNPYVYILFILLYPLNRNRNILLVSSFFLGLIIDSFSGSWGVHAFACVFLGFTVKPLISSLSSRNNFEKDTFSFYDLNLLQKFFYVFFSVFIHHSVLFLIENFKFKDLGFVMLNTIYSMLITMSILFVYFGLVIRRKE